MKTKKLVGEAKKKKKKTPINQLASIRKKREEKRLILHDAA